MHDELQGAARRDRLDDYIMITSFVFIGLYLEFRLLLYCGREITWLTRETVRVSLKP